MLKDIVYDYESKTTQDLNDAEIDNFAENYYELSENGKCPQYCTQCIENDKSIKCINCKTGYTFNEKKNICSEEKEEEEKEKKEEKKSKKYIYIIVFSLIAIIIITVIAIFLMNNFKSNKNIMNEVDKISFEKEENDYKNIENNDKEKNENLIFQ